MKIVNSIKNFVNGSDKMFSNNGEIEIVVESTLDNNLNEVFSVYSLDHKFNAVLETCYNVRLSDLYNTMVTMASNADNYTLEHRLILSL